MVRKKRWKIRDCSGYLFPGRIILIWTMLICFSMTMRAQEKDISHSSQQWFQYYNQLLFSDTWSVLTDAGYRLTDGFTESTQLFIRSGVGYKPHEALRLVLGVAYIGLFETGDLYKTEFRTYQEATLNEIYGKIETGHRFQIEQRFFHTPAREGLPEENSFHYRFRYRFGVAIPLLKLSALHPDRRLWLNLGDEIALNAGKEIVHHIFDQNRATIGTVLQWNDRFSVSFTYNHQFKSGEAPDTYEQDHVFWLGVKHIIDLTGKNASTTERNSG